MILALCAGVVAGTLILIEPLWPGLAVELAVVAVLAVVCWRVAGLPTSPAALLAPEGGSRPTG